MAVNGIVSSLVSLLLHGSHASRSRGFEQDSNSLFHAESPSGGGEHPPHGAACVGSFEAVGLETGLFHGERDDGTGCVSYVSKQT